jgi:1-acyl-sn-glycerol-3-phosphate acyltransferase
MKDVLGTLYLLWPAIVIGIVILTVLSILLGGVFIVFLLMGYYAFQWLKKKGVFEVLFSWLRMNEKIIGDELQNHLQKTFLLRGNLSKETLEIPTLYIAHPHGLFSMAPFLHWAAGVTEWPKTSTKIHIAVHSIFFKIPFVKELMESYGAIEATEEAIRRVLQQGDSVALLTGGVEELNKTESGKMNIVLKKRTGFLRIARDLEIPIVPVLTFGENELFPPIRGYWIAKVQDYLKKWFGIALPIPTWQSIENWFSLLKGPLEQKVITWVGKPILSNKKESLQTIRDKIIHAVVELYKEGRPIHYPHTLQVF